MRLAHDDDLKVEDNLYQFWHTSIRFWRPCRHTAWTNSLSTFVLLSCRPRYLVIKVNWSDGYNTCRDYAFEFCSHQEPIIVTRASILSAQIPLHIEYYTGSGASWRKYWRCIITNRGQGGCRRMASFGGDVLSVCTGFVNRNQFGRQNPRRACSRRGMLWELLDRRSGCGWMMLREFLQGFLCDELFLAWRRGLGWWWSNDEELLMQSFCGQEVYIL